MSASSECCGTQDIDDIGGRRGPSPKHKPGKPTRSALPKPLPPLSVAAPGPGPGLRLLVLKVDALVQPPQGGREGDGGGHEAAVGALQEAVGRQDRSTRRVGGGGMPLPLNKRSKYPCTG